MTPRSLPPVPDTPWRSFVKLLWRSPLLAIPFAVFFGTIYGTDRGAYVSAYVVSLVFTGTISVFIWVTRWFLMPRFMPKAGPLPLGILFASMAMLGTFASAIILNLTVAPGFLGSFRSVAILAMYGLLFVVLFMGVNYAMRFYQDSLERAKTDQELDLARRIQRSFLLSQFPAHPRLEVHAMNVSSKQVSGDFYDVVPAGGDTFWLAVADVSGKGVPAALLSSMLQASLRTQAQSVASVADVMGNINRLAYDRTPAEQFATFILARIDESAMRLTYVNAGHNFPLLFRRGASLRTLERGGVPVGFLENAAYEEETFDLVPGDRLVFYTDGITEAANPEGEMFGDVRLVEAIAAIPGEAGALEVTERVLAAVRVFLGAAEPGDDMTVLTLRVLAGNPEPSVKRE